MRHTFKRKIIAFSSNEEFIFSKKHAIVKIEDFQTIKKKRQFQKQMIVIVCTILQIFITDN